MFVLVEVDSIREGAQPRITDLAGAAVMVPPAEIDRFRSKYRKLIVAFERDHACEVAAKVVYSHFHLPNPPPHRAHCRHPGALTPWVTPQKQLLSGGSTHGGAHAEENLLIQCYTASANWTAVELDSMLIDIEPCYGGRYPGHFCRQLFGLGRNVNVPGAGHGGAPLAVPMRFLPKLGHPYTPILYFQQQPLRGEKAEARKWKQGKNENFRDAKTYRLGPPPGTQFYTNIKQTTKS